MLSCGVIKDELSDCSVSDFNNIAFPLVRRASAATLAMGGTRKSKIQQLKEDRINKLRKLNGEAPNIKLPDDVIIDGLVSVQPMTTPSLNLMYFDFKYDLDDSDDLKEKVNVIKLNNKKKLKYILKNNKK